MITYVWQNMYDIIWTTYEITSTLYDITPHYDITPTVFMSSHQDTCHLIHCSWTIIYSVLIIPHLLHVWNETHNMYDITGILNDITFTLYDITILYSWLHIHSSHDSTPKLYDITYSILASSQPLYLWQDTSYVYDIIHNIYDISHGLWMTIQPRYPTTHSQYV